MKKSGFLIFVTLFILLLASCRSKDDVVPEIVVEPISKVELIGGWKVLYTDVLWDLTSHGNNLDGFYGLKSKLKKKVAEDAAYHSIFFTDSVLFYVRYRPNEDPSFPYYIRQSNYSLSDGDKGYYINLEFDNLLGFKCNRLYMKKNEVGQMVFYLQKDQVVQMAEDELDRTYVSKIKSDINSAEVDFYTQRDTLPVYTYIVEEMLYW